VYDYFHDPRIVDVSSSSSFLKFWIAMEPMPIFGVLVDVVAHPSQPQVWIVVVVCG
jgi:hypothetical protein